MNRHASLANIYVMIPSQQELESTEVWQDPIKAFARAQSCPAALAGFGDRTTVIGPASPTREGRFPASQPASPFGIPRRKKVSHSRLDRIYFELFTDNCWFKQRTIRERFHRIVSSCTSTPSKVFSSAQKNLYLSRRALCGGPPLLSLKLDISEGMESLVDECGSGNGTMSELEAEFRREVSVALDIPVSSVMVDCLRTPSAGCTEVCKLRSLHVQS